jgi:pyrroloquinoline quinone (PQQ) biosynthesis protein C
MIADALRLEIEAHAARVRMSNPLLHRAAAGEVSPAAVERYLVTLRYMIANTPPNLALARDQARDAELDALAVYYSEKLAEEDGHERWADHDLQVLRDHGDFAHHRDPAPSAVVLNRFLQRTIHRDPVLYLAYVLWAEYFTTLVGGEVVQHLVERCHMPAEALTCLSKHVELDKDHTEENLDALDALVGDPRMLEPLRRVLDTSMALFDRLCEEIVEADLAEHNGRIAS